MARPGPDGRSGAQSTSSSPPSSTCACSAGAMPGWWTGCSRPWELDSHSVISLLANRLINGVVRMALLGTAVIALLLGASPAPIESFVEAPGPLGPLKGTLLAP